MHVLGRFGDGRIDCRRGRVLVLFGAFVIHVNTLVGGRLAEGDRVSGSGGDARLTTDAGKLPKYAGERRRQRVEAEIGEPEAEI